MTVSHLSMKNWVRRGRLAKALGIPAPTIKYYTALGLFPVPGKTPRGQYLYDLEDIRRRYAAIKKLKEKRFTIPEIKQKVSDTFCTFGDCFV